MELTNVRQMLRINRHRLDEELEVNSDIQERIGREVARRNSLMLEAKRALEDTEARVIADLKEADAKMSNPIAEKEAKRHRDYKTAWASYQVARQEHEEWEAAHKAWITRSFDLKALGELYGFQYFTIDSVQRAREPAFGQKISDQRSERVRSEMRNKTGDFSKHQESETRPRRRTLVDS